MKNNKFRMLFLSFSVIALMLIVQACKKTFLDAQPYGQYTSELIKNKKGLMRFNYFYHFVIDLLIFASEPS